MSTTPERALVMHRRAILAAAPTAATRGCLLVYPPSKKSRQRFGVGDGSGTFTVYAFNKTAEDGCTAVFSTATAKAKDLQVDEDNARRPINCATLYTDQLFVMRGSVLDAYSRKGTHFFHVDTSVTESAHSLVIDTPFIFAAGEFILTTMKETTELGFYLAPDRIHAMTAFVAHDATTRRTGERTIEQYLCCLACNDRVLRLVQSGTLRSEIPCTSTPTALHWSPAQEWLYVGMQDGALEAWCVQPSPTASTLPLRRCMHHTPTTAPTAVCCMTCHDVDGDGVQELLVGYEDGTVRVFALVMGAVATLHVLWCGEVGERVVGIAAGVVTATAAHPDLLVQLFSGQVIGFNVVQVRIAADAANAEPQVDGVERPRRTGHGNVDGALGTASAGRDEIATLQAEVAALRESVQKATHALAERSGARHAELPVVAVAATFHAELRLEVIDGSALLALVVEASVPLSAAVLRAAVPALLVQGTSSTRVVLCDTGRHTNVGECVALLQPMAADHVEEQQEHGKRLEIRLGAWAAVPVLLFVTLYAIPSPRTAQLRTVSLQALPYWVRLGAPDPDWLPEQEAEVVMSSLTCAGNVELEVVREGLSRLLRDFPVTMATAPTTVYYRHGLLSSVLWVGVAPAAGYGGGVVVTCASDSLDALAVLRREMTSLALAHRVQLTVEQDIRATSAHRTVGQLWHLLHHHARASRQALLREGLRELHGVLDATAESAQSMVPAAIQAALLSDTAAPPPAHVTFATHALAALLHSMIGFNMYSSTPVGAAPTPDALDRLLQHGASLELDSLVRFFFPCEEHLVKRRELEEVLRRRRDRVQETASAEVDVRRRSGTLDSGVPSEVASMVTAHMRGALEDAAES